MSVSKIVLDWSKSLNHTIRLQSQVRRRTHQASRQEMVEHYGTYHRLVPQCVCEVAERGQEFVDWFEFRSALVSFKPNFVHSDILMQPFSASSLYQECRGINLKLPIGGRSWRIIPAINVLDGPPFQVRLWLSNFVCLLYCSCGHVINDLLLITWVSHQLMSDVKNCVVTLGLHFISGDGQIRFQFSGIFLKPEAKDSNHLDQTPYQCCHHFYYFITVFDICVCDIDDVFLFHVYIWYSCCLCFIKCLRRSQHMWIVTCRLSLALPTLTSAWYDRRADQAMNVMITAKMQQSKTFALINIVCLM